MALFYKLKRNEIRSNKSFGKWFAIPVKMGTLGMDVIEQRVQNNCSMKRSDVRAVLCEVQEVIKDGLLSGMVVDLGELGKFQLSPKSVGADSPLDFTKRNIKGVRCNYTPYGYRRGNGDRTIQRDFFKNVDFERLKSD
ncbi:MAG: hypothetical protein IJ604_07690 [Prevotella sp.]|nr:hypothetical protein [Prevotella sp.]